MVGSDAHIAQGVGVFADALKLIGDAGVPEGQIVNASWQRILDFLEIEE